MTASGEQPRVLALWLKWNSFWSARAFGLFRNYPHVH